MSARSIRRAAERKANKLARKAGIGPAVPQPTATPAQPTTQSGITEPGRPFPFLDEMCSNGADAGGHPEPEATIPSGRALDTAPVLHAFSDSPARLAANRENALKSSGPKTEEG